MVYCDGDKTDLNLHGLLRIPVPASISSSPGVQKSAVAWRLGIPIGHVCFENEWLAKAAGMITGKIDIVLFYCDLCHQASVPPFGWQCETMFLSSPW